MILRIRGCSTGLMLCPFSSFSLHSGAKASSCAAVPPFAGTTSTAALSFLSYPWDQHSHFLSSDLRCFCEEEHQNITCTMLNGCIFPIKVIGKQNANSVKHNSAFCTWQTLCMNTVWPHMCHCTVPLSVIVFCSRSNDSRIN